MNIFFVLVGQNQGFVCKCLQAEDTAAPASAVIPASWQTSCSCLLCFCSNRLQRYKVLGYQKLTRRKVLLVAKEVETHRVKDLKMDENSFFCFWGGQHFKDVWEPRWLWHQCIVAVLSGKGGTCDRSDKRLGGRLGKLQPLPSLKSKCFLCARIHLVKMRLMFHLTIESNSRWEKKFEE